MAFTFLVACAPTAVEAPVNVDGRALAPARWEAMKLLPAAAIAPPPTREAPAFAPVATTPEGYSVGPTNAGSIVGAVALPADLDAVRIRPIALKRAAYFGTPGMVAMLVKVAERVAREHPASVLHAGDLSLEQGGALAPHASHTSGRDVDLSFYVSRAEGGALVPADGPEMRYVDAAGRVSGTDLVFDDARNWALVRAMLEDPGATPQWIFVASHLRARLLAHAHTTGADPSLIAKAEAALIEPRDSSPHADHFHVRIYCGLAERLQGCLDAPPFHRFAPDHAPALTRWLEGLLPFLATPHEPETREAIERIVRMNATPAIPHLERLVANNPPSPLTALASDAIDFLKGRRTPTAWQKWRAIDAPP